MDTTVAPASTTRALVPMTAVSSIKYPARLTKLVYNNHGFKRLRSNPIPLEEDHILIYNCQKKIITRPALDRGIVIDIFA